MYMYSPKISPFFPLPTAQAPLPPFFCTAIYVHILEDPVGYIWGLLFYHIGPQRSCHLRK